MCWCLSIIELKMHGETLKYVFKCLIKLVSTFLKSVIVICHTYVMYDIQREIQWAG